MTPEIVEKLQKEISSGIVKESQVVYLLAGIRKIMEQDGLNTYEYLKFHCDWALHARLRGPFPQKILSHFDSACSELPIGKYLPDGSEANKITKMNQFREEISNFLRAYSISDFSSDLNSWAKFLCLYSQVVEDADLILRDSNSATKVKKIVISVDTALEQESGHRVFKVSWWVETRDSNPIVFFTLNSFKEKY